MLRVVNANMEKAVRVVSIERGFDPRKFALVAFGGAGPLHAAELASALAIPTAIIPAMPGALSAFGILVSDVVRDYSRTLLLRVDGKVPRASLAETFARMEATARKEFRTEGWKAKPELMRTIDIRYAGQGYELNVPFSSRMLPEFHSEHQRRYGYSHPERSVELVTIRLRATLRSSVKHREADLRKQSTVRSFDSVWFGGSKLRTQIFRREDIPEGKRFKGPAIITEYSATTVVPPGWKFEVKKPMGDIVLIAEDRGSSQIKEEHPRRGALAKSR